MHGFEEDSPDSFEDVDLDSSDQGSEDGGNDDQISPHHINSQVSDAEWSDGHAIPLKAQRYRVPSEEAYNQAFTPFHTDTGTPYPCSQNDLDAHKDCFFRNPNHHTFVSAISATREIILHNHTTRRVPPIELIAIDNLQRVIYFVQKRMDFSPDLAIKMFADLDLIFFCGRLQDHVIVQCVKASDCTNMAASRGGQMAATIPLPDKRGKCLIRLNADLLLLQQDYEDDDPLRLILATLLHEMCHAYRLVRCGQQSPLVKKKRCSHDAYFGTMIAVVHERAMRFWGLWAIGRDEVFIQTHFLPGEETAMGVVMGWMMDVVLDVDDKVVEKMDEAADIVEWGMIAVKRWMGVEDEVVD